MFGKHLDRFRSSGSKRPLSKPEREKRRRVLVVMLIVLAIVSATSIVVYGHYDTNVKPWHQRIAKVNGTIIEMRPFVKALRLGGVTNLTQAMDTASMMIDKELMRQYLQSEFNVVITEEDVDTKIRGILVSDNATDEEFEERYDNLAAVLKRYKLSVKDYRDLFIKPLLVEEALKKQIGDRDYPATSSFEHVQVQALLVEGSDNATQLKARWENGEAFDELIEDESVSDHYSAEWVPRGIRSEAFDSYAFGQDTPLDAIGDPFRDSDASEKYWIIKVLGREDRLLSESDRDTLIDKAFDRWLKDFRNSEDNEIVNYLDEEGGRAKIYWALDHV